jgi:uncharacterized membrane protein YidH (DUF202 family)
VPSEPLPPLDPGLANERTALATTRTALSFVVIAGLTARLGWAGRFPLAGYIAATLLVGVAVALLLSGLVVYRARLRGGLVGSLRRARPTELRLIARSTTVAAIVGFVLAIATR